MSANSETPRVAVVMPCYNQGKYLREAVQSVFGQSFTDWEIVIVNDGSSDDSEQVAKAIISENPGHRITLISQANAGPSAARNRAIQATHAGYILPLDADDRITPNAIARMTELLDRDPRVAIAYSDWDHFGAVQGVRKALEYDFKYLCEKENLFTCTSMFRREAWEKTGGFKLNMNLGLEDWEFWISCGELGFVGKRIPEVLFHYRIKEQSRNTKVQEHYRVMFAQIILNHPRLYAPATVQAAEQIMRLHKAAPASTDLKARVADLLATARQLAEAGQKREALACLKDVVALAKTPEVVKQVEAIMLLLKPGAGAAPAAPTSLADLVKRFDENPGDVAARTELEKARERVFAALWSARQAGAAVALTSANSDTYRTLLDSSLFLHEAPALTVKLAEWPVGDAVRTLAQALVQAPWKTVSVPSLRTLSDEVRVPFLRYLLRAPHCMTEARQADAYGEHFARVTESVTAYVVSKPEPVDVRGVLEAYLLCHSCIPLYVAAGNTRPWMQARARLIERYLALLGCQLDYVAPVRATAGRKIRVGFVSHHFGHQTETYVTLGNLNLDRSRFEIVLFAAAGNPGPVEDYCRSKADEFHLLPKSIREQVATIRASRLDCVIIGTNVTAVTNTVAMIAAHRLAPIQIISYCSPMTSGMKNADYFLHSSHTRVPAADDHFSERLIVLNGPPGCMDYRVEPRGQSVPASREQLGIGPEEVVFLNAASCYKVSHEALECWCEILREAPGSRLMLMPYNPNWTSRFPRIAFEGALRKLADRHGVAWERFVIVPGQTTRQAVKDIESVADLYLDTFPFAGSLAVFDLMELGIPSVVRSGETFRSNFSAAILKEFGLDELICGTTADYIAKALALARDPVARARQRDVLRRGFESGNRATSPERFGAELSERLLELCAK